MEGDDNPAAHRNGQYFDLLYICSRPNNFLEYSIEIKLEYMCISDSTDPYVFGKGGCFGQSCLVLANSSTFNYNRGNEMPGAFFKFLDLTK